MSWEELAAVIGTARSKTIVAQDERKQLAAGTLVELAETDDDEEDQITDEFFPPDATEAHVEEITDALDADDEEPDPLEEEEEEEEEEEGQVEML